MQNTTATSGRGTVAQSVQVVQNCSLLIESDHGHANYTLSKFKVIEPNSEKLDKTFRSVRRKGFIKEVIAKLAQSVQLART